MNTINKAYIYEQLNTIHRNKHIDIQPYIDLMIGKEEIPYEVVVFINKHIPIDKLTTYNNIYEKRKKNRLFRNIVNDNLPVEERAIVLSSLLNQSLIGIKHSNKEDKNSIIDAVNIDLIFRALEKYIYENDENIINEVFDTFQLIFKTLFPKK